MVEFEKFVDAGVVCVNLENVEDLSRPKGYNVWCSLLLLPPMFAKTFATKNDI